MLRVSMLGNLGADPETRATQKGAMVTTFRVAVRQVRSGPDGERQESTEWFRVRAMGRLSEYAQRLTRGQRVLVVGRLEIAHFQGRDGEPRVGFDVWADEVQNLSPRPAGAEGEDAAERTPIGVGAAAPASAPSAATSTNGARPARGRGGSAVPDEDLEDLPF